MRGARGVLINITGGNDMTLFEVDEAANRIRDEVEVEDANIIFGSCFDESLEGKLRVSVVATGIPSTVAVQPRPVKREEPRVVAVPKAMSEVRPAPAPRPAQPAVASFAPAAFAPAGGTLAPATGTTELAIEEQTLADLAAAARSVEAEAPAQVAVEPAPAPMMVEPAPVMAAPVAAPAPVAPAPIAAQAAAVAEAMAMAKSVTPAMRMAPPAPARDVFIPRAPMDPRTETRSPSLPLGEPAAKVAAPAPAPVVTEAPAEAPKPEGRLSLFSRYRSLTTKPKAEPVVENTTETRVERPSFAVAVNPTDRAGVTSHDEDELEIPAFLRRQAN
jgi:cell division protein FtsZ